MSRKASSLAELERRGFRVPTGFTLDATHYQAATAQIRDQLADVGTGRGSAARLFDDVAVPADTARAIERGLSRFPPSTRFAVRSSGNIVARGERIAEDGSATSLAGQFETYLNVPNERVGDAVRQCWASLFNRRSVELFGIDADYVEKSTMTVLVQEMIAAASSAVVMTVDPLGDGSNGAVELALGPCEAIVGGAVSPDEITFRRRDGAIVDRRIGAKAFSIEYGSFARGAENTFKRAVPQSMRERFAVGDHTLVEVIDLACAIERVFGSPQDIELVVDDAGRITVVQARPISRLPDQIVPLPESARTT